MGSLHIETAQAAGPGSLVFVKVRGVLDTANAQELQYHLEAAVFVRGPCEFHIDLSAVDGAVDDRAWVDALRNAARTASRRSCRMYVCRFPSQSAPVYAVRELPVCAVRDEVVPRHSPAS